MYSALVVVYTAYCALQVRLILHYITCLSRANLQQCLYDNYNKLYRLCHRRGRYSRYKLSITWSRTAIDHASSNT